MKLCIDCKFHVLEPNNLYPHKCKHPWLAGTNYVSPVTGLESKSLADCERERGFSTTYSLSKCNDIGTLFEPKEPADTDIITWVKGVGLVLGEVKHD